MFFWTYVWLHSSLNTGRMTSDTCRPRTKIQRSNIMFIDNIARCYPYKRTSRCPCLPLMWHCLWMVWLLSFATMQKCDVFPIQYSGRNFRSFDCIVTCVPPKGRALGFKVMKVFNSTGIVKVSPWCSFISVFLAWNFIDSLSFKFGAFKRRFSFWR